MSKSKRTTDKFYTKEEVAEDIISRIPLEEFENVIEPSAGAGSFSSKIDGCIAIDTDPLSEEIKRQDFFQFEFQGDPSNTIVIGNPPFGRQGSKALSFIKKASEIADAIGFILPKSFKKDSMKRKVPDHFHVRKEFDLPEKSFVYKGEDYEVPAIFQLWVRENVPRLKHGGSEPFGFAFLKPPKYADFTVRRVGVYAGEASLTFRDKSRESHYFLRLDKRIKSKRVKIVETLNQTEFPSSKDTSGPNSISKDELTKKLNPIIEEMTDLSQPDFW